MNIEKWIHHAYRLLAEGPASFIYSYTVQDPTQEVVPPWFFPPQLTIMTINSQSRQPPRDMLTGQLNLDNSWSLFQVGVGCANSTVKTNHQWGLLTRRAHGITGVVQAWNLKILAQATGTSSGKRWNWYIAEFDGGVLDGERKKANVILKTCCFPSVWATGENDKHPGVGFWQMHCPSLNKSTFTSNLSRLIASSLHGEK